MWYQIAIAILFAMVFSLAIYAHISEARQDAQVLRHTIGVNLDILQAELVNLNPFADQVPDSADKQKALQLLKQADVTARGARQKLCIVSSWKLEALLGEVFGAMIKVTEARHLLNAIGV